MLRCPILLFLLVALQPSRQTVLCFTPTTTSFGYAQRSTSGPTSKSSLHLGDFFNFGKPKEGASGTDALDTATATEPKEEKEGYYDEDDPVEKIFGFFFGKKEQAPLG